MLEGIWLISYLVLWACVITLALLTLSLARLVGQLHRRLGPTGALVTDHGPDIGERLAEILNNPGLSTGTELAFPRQRELLLLFVSPRCPACIGLVRELEPFNAGHPDLDFVVTSVAQDSEKNGRLGGKVFRTGFTYLVHPELARAFRVGPTPYAVWLDREGVVRAKGIVNHVEHLESLRHARESGFATLHDYFDDLEATGELSGTHRGNRS
jgi:methylamine dehydrogenase accessory protein MauD